MRRPVRHPDRHDGQMDDDDARPGLPVQVKGVRPGTAGFGPVRALAARVLAQDRYLTWHFPDALESHVLGAYHGTRCVGFLRFLIQVLGAEAGRPAVIYNGESLKEGYVEAFGVDPQLRRRGIGTALRGLGDGPVGIDAQQAGRLEVGPAHEVETELADEGPAVGIDHHVVEMPVDVARQVRMTYEGAVGLAAQ